MPEERLRHLCPFCLDAKTHIERHMKSCGKLSDINAKLVFAREKERRERLTHVRLFLPVLQSMYGSNWPLIAHSLLSVEIPIHVKKNEHLHSLQDLNRYLTAKGIELSGRFPMTVSYINASSTTQSENVQGNTTEPIPSTSNLTENMGKVESRFRTNVVSSKTKSTATQTSLSSKSPNQLPPSETTQIPAETCTSATVTLSPKRQTNINRPVLSPSATPSKQCSSKTIVPAPLRSPVQSQKSPVRPCSVFIEKMDVAFPSSSSSNQYRVDTVATSPVKSLYPVAKCQSVNTIAPQTKTFKGKRKRHRILYTEGDAKVEDYCDDVRDKTYSPRQDKGSDEEDDVEGCDNVLKVKIALSLSMTDIIKQFPSLH